MSLLSRRTRQWLAAASLLLAALVPSAQANGELAPVDVSPSLPALSLAPATGFISRDFDWLDPSRQRLVPVRLHLPEGSSAAHPVPLVVFSHGIGGSRRGYSYLGQYWASQGYASLHLQHVGSDRAVWTGNPLGVIGRLQSAAQESEAVDRVKDLRFALDQLLSSELSPLIDAQRIVAAGHSYGANTTLLAIGARVQRAGQWLDLRDSRLRAAIVISAPPFYGEAAPEPILGGIAVPTLHITATEDVIRVPGYYSPASDRLQVFNAVGGVDKTLAVFTGGSHSIFTDRAGTGGAALNPQVKRATQALSLAFLRRIFEGDESGLKQWPERFGPLLTRYSAAPH